MSRWHRYHPDWGGVAASRRVADRTAVGPDPAPRRPRWPIVLLVLTPGLVALAAWAAGWLIGALS